MSDVIQFENKEKFHIFIVEIGNYVSRVAIEQKAFRSTELKKEFSELNSLVANNIKACTVMSLYPTMHNEKYIYIRDKESVDKYIKDVIAIKKK